MKHILPLFTLLIFLTPFYSLALQVNKNPLQAKLVQDEIIVPPGANKEIQIDLKLADEHHAYLDQFRLKIKEPGQLLIGEFKVNPIVEWRDVHSKKMKKGIQGQATISAVIEAPLTDEHKLEETLLLTYQACTEKYCLLPKTIKLPLSLVLAKTTMSQGPSEKAFSLEGPSLLERAEDLGWLSVFALVFLAGILTSFTPCIFPMIPITLAVLGNQNNNQPMSKGSGFRVAFVYVSGIALTYAVLGLIAASTGALFGSLLGHPVAIMFISLIFFLMGLSMFGLFEIQAPAGIREKLQTGRNSKGFVSTFLTGLFAGLVASPCVGPVLVSVLTFVAQTQNLILGFFLLLAFAYGMGLIFLVLGTFSGLINKIPRSGPWLNFSKFFFGSLMIGVSLYFAYPVLERTVFKSHQQEVSKLNWQTYSDDLLAKAKAEGKPVIIDFWAEWCAACHELEEKTFSQKEIDELSKNFVLLKFDRTEESSEFETLQERYGIVGLPFVAFHSPQGTFLKDNTLTGFEEAPDFAQRMKRALDSKE